MTIVRQTAHPAFPNGEQTIHRFDNGLGASVIRFHDPTYGAHSYGGDQGLFELAVLRFTDTTWSIVYDTPITDDVLGYLTEADVAETLKRIEAL